MRLIFASCASSLSIFALKHAELGDAEGCGVWARDRANRLPAIANTTNARTKLPLVNHAPGQKFETAFWSDAHKCAGFAASAPSPLIINVCAGWQSGSAGSTAL